MSNQANGREGMPELPNEAREAIGSRLRNVFDDLVSHTQREVQSWLDACDALCQTAQRDNNEVLLTLARNRGQTIADDLAYVLRMFNAFNVVETRIRALRRLYRESLGTRDTVRRRARQQAIEETDELSMKLLDAERKRADLFGEAVRVAQRAGFGAKELYGQVSALSGHGRVDRVAGFAELRSVDEQPSMTDSGSIGSEPRENQSAGGVDEIDAWSQGDIRHAQ